MNWMNKMERKFGRYAIHNLTVVLLVCYVVGFIVSFTIPELLYYFTLEPGLILRGRVWRLISWIIVPPSGNIIAIIFILLLYSSLGRTLESVWGAFRYNIYIFSGFLFTIIGAFISYFISGGLIGFGGSFSTYYINMSIFLACASIMPNMELLLYGILPVKLKWLAYLNAAMLAVNFFQGGLITKIAIGASLLNFVIFFLNNKNMQPYKPKQVARRKKFKQEMQRPVNHYEGGAKHKCAVCGRTELDNPNLEFRYCSKCNGNYEYCQDHLFTHEHVK